MKYSSGKCVGFCVATFTAIGKSTVSKPWKPFISWPCLECCTLFADQSVPRRRAALEKTQHGWWKQHECGILSGSKINCRVCGGVQHMCLTASIYLNLLCDFKEGSSLFWGGPFPWSLVFCVFSHIWGSEIEDADVLSDCGGHFNAAIRTWILWCIQEESISGMRCIYVYGIYVYRER